MKIKLIIGLCVFLNYTLIAQTSKMEIQIPSKKFYMNGIHDMGENGMLMLFVDAAPGFSQGAMVVKHISTNNELIWEKEVARHFFGGTYGIKHVRVMSSDNYIYLLQLATFNTAANQGNMNIVQIDKKGNVIHKLFKEHENFKTAFAFAVNNDHLKIFQTTNSKDEHEYFINLLNHKNLTPIKKIKINFPPPPQKLATKANLVYFVKWVYSGEYNDQSIFYKKYITKTGNNLKDPVYQIAFIAPNGRTEKQLLLSPMLENNKYILDAVSPHIDQGYYYGPRYSFDNVASKNLAPPGIGQISDIYFDKSDEAIYIAGRYGSKSYSLMMAENYTGYFITKYNLEGEKIWHNQIDFKKLKLTPDSRFNISYDSFSNNLKLIIKSFEANAPYRSKKLATYMITFSKNGEIINKCNGSQSKEMYTGKMKKLIYDYFNSDKQLRYISSSLVKSCNGFSSLGSNGYKKIAQLNKGVEQNTEVYYYIKRGKSSDIVVQYLWKEKIINSFYIEN